MLLPIINLSAKNMSVSIAESFENWHKEKIYRVLESEIKARAPDLQLMFNGIVDWGWIGEAFCLFFQPGSLFAFFCRAADQPLPMFLRDFGSRHGIRVELAEVDPSVSGLHSPYRQKAID